MKLYHGTSEKNWKSISRNGLCPRKPGSLGNHPDVPSGLDRVYLTNVYAPLYAHHTSRDNGHGILIEIDTEKLNPLNLVPDEDWLAQAIKRNGYERPPERELGGAALVKRMRKVAIERPDLSMASIEEFGTIAHIGKISPAAFTRIAIFPIKHWPKIVLAGYDPVMTIMAHSLMKGRYLNWTRWFFNDREESVMLDCNRPDRSEFDIKIFCLG
jgi:hypothetical protein